MRLAPSLVAVALAAGVLTACGDDGDDAGATNASQQTEEASRPQVVVTTTVLGDIVGEALGDHVDVEVIVPIGADPHEFAASTRQAESMAEADLLVVNGAGFEEGMAGLIDAAEEAGAAVFSFADHVDLLDLDGEDEHAGEEHAEDEEHSEGAGDPHIWTDPSRMADAVEALGARAGELDGVDVAEVEARAAAYAAQLRELDGEIEGLLGDVPADRRLLVTNHEALGYFADRYDFEIVGAVIPSISTSASASAADVEELADLMRERDVRAIFGETTQPTQLAEALASEVGRDVEVVELFTESLGEDGTGAETYLGMMRVNAQLISAALT